NSSSRGKKTFPALGTRPVGSHERHVCSSISLHGSRMTTSCMERPPTFRTLWGWILRSPSPFSARTGLRRLFENPCFQLHHPSMHLFFYFHILRSWMRFAPLCDICQDLCTQFLQWIIHFRLLLISSRWTYVTILSFSWISPLQKSVPHP